MLTSFSIHYDVPCPGVCWHSLSFWSGLVLLQGVQKLLAPLLHPQSSTGTPEQRGLPPVMGSVGWEDCSEGGAGWQEVVLLSSWGGGLSALFWASGTVRAVSFSAVATSEKSLMEVVGSCVPLPLVLR